MKTNKDGMIKYINKKLAEGYEGYIQPLSRKIDDSSVFLGDKTALNSDEIIYEAHFFSKSKNKSVCVRQINGCWFVNTTNLKELGANDTQIFFDKLGKNKIKMAQIWKEEKDEFCTGLSVLKLKKVVFAGFVREDEK